jgi:hypothetical protein
MMSNIIIIVLAIILSNCKQMCDLFWLQITGLFESSIENLPENPTPGSYWTLKALVSLG